MHDLPPVAPQLALRWDVDRLWAQLDAALPGMSVEVHPSVESTNTVLIERARKLAGRLDAPVSTPGDLDRLAPGNDRQHDRSSDQGPYGRRAVDTHPSLLVAEHQTLGRGRLGRDWLSQPRRSLTMSLGLPMRPRQWGGLSLAVGVALADALDPLAEPDSQPRIGLKWPNDLWLIDASASNGVGRKLGGVLIETVPVGAQRMVVVGVGLNIVPRAQPTGDGTTSRLFASGFASLSELESAASAPDTLHRVALPLVQALKRFDVEGLEPFKESFARRDVLAGRRVVVRRSAPSASTAPASAEVTVVGISAHGGLLVRDTDRGTADAPVIEVTSGEVSVSVDEPTHTGAGRFFSE